MTKPRGSAVTIFVGDSKFRQREYKKFMDRKLKNGWTVSARIFELIKKDNEAE